MSNLRHRHNLMLISNVWEAVIISLFWGPTESMNYQKVILNFPSTEWANDNGPFQQASHGTYSNSGTQVVAQNKNLVTVSRWTQLEV